MSKLSPAKSREVVKVLTVLGFKKTRQKGSHARFRHADSRKTSVPIHKGKDISVGTLASILRDIGLSVNDFLKLK